MKIQTKNVLRKKNKVKKGDATWEFNLPCHVIRFLEVKVQLTRQKVPNGNAKFKHSWGEL